MAEAKFTIKWTSDLRELRKSFAEVDKLQKKHHKVRDNFRKTEDKHHKQQLKQSKELFGFREKQLKGEEKILLRQHRTQQKMYRDQHREARLVERNFNQTKRKLDQHERDDRRKQQQQNKRGAARSLVTGAIGFGLGAIGGMLMGAAFQGYENYINVHRQLGAGIGLGTGNLMRNAGRASKGGNLGFNIQERAALEPGMARATGYGGPAGIRDLMTAQRATGMEAGEATDIFSAIRGGIAPTGQDQQGRRKKIQKEFADIQAAAIASDLPKALRPEFMSGIAQLIRVQQQDSGEAVSGVGIAKLLAAGNRSGLAAFQGERGVSNFMRFDQALKQPGGGDEGLGLIQRAMGFGKAGGTGFFGAERMREKGLVDDPQNFERLMKQITLETGGEKDEMAKMLQSVGAAPSLSVADKFVELFNQDSPLTERMDAIKKEMEKSKSIEQQAHEAMKESGTRLAYIATKFDESVSIGAKSAGTLEAVEHLQREFVKFMFNKIPELVKDIKFLLKVFGEFWTDFKYVANAMSPVKLFTTEAEEKRNKALAGDLDRMSQQAFSNVPDMDMPSWLKKNGSAGARFTKGAPGVAKGSLPPEVESYLRSSAGGDRSTAQGLRKKMQAAGFGEGGARSEAPATEMMSKLDELIKEAREGNAINKSKGGGRDPGASYHPSAPSKRSPGRADSAGR